METLVNLTITAAFVHLFSRLWEFASMKHIPDLVEHNAPRWPVVLLLLLLLVVVVVVVVVKIVSEWP